MQYSGTQVNKAGRSLLTSEIFEKEEDISRVMDVVSEWRFSHEKPLMRAFEILQSTVKKKDRDAIFAKRLKRFVSIVLKLRRFENMNLKNMQDIGGCRAIVSNQKKLHQVLRELKRRREFKWEDGKTRIKDYIDKPKADGYRSIHIIGKFADAQGDERRIEIQLRTFIQHYWATALEIVDLFTMQALKSNQGRKEWMEFFSGVSHQFAILESIHRFADLPLREKYRSYRRKLDETPGALKSCKSVQTCARKLNVFDKLNAFSGSVEVANDQLSKASKSGYVLLIIRLKKRNVTTRVYSSRESEKAESDYANQEKEFASDDDTVVALVSSNSVGGVKKAYPNYFADSSKFLEYLNLVLEI